MQPPTISQSNIINKLKGIIIVPIYETGSLHHKYQFEMTLHINTPKVRLSNHVHSAVGGIVFVEIGMRNYQIVLTIDYGYIVYIKFHIYNV